MNLFEEMTKDEVQAFYDDGIVINKISMEDVVAYRLPLDKLINISDAPKWVQDFAYWDNGDLRMALRKPDNALVILTTAETLIANPGDWLVWPLAEEGQEQGLAVFNPVEFEKRYYL